MSIAVVEDIAKRAAKEALMEYVRESKEAAKKEVRKKTKKLMANYNSIKAHVEEGVSEAMEMEIDFVREDLDEDDLYIMSIRRSRIRSMIMMSHIDKCLDLLKAEQKRRGTPEKYEIYNGHYIKERTYEELAESFHCSERTAMRCVSELDDMISVLLFGMEGITFD